MEDFRQFFKSMASLADGPRSLHRVSTRCRETSITLYIISPAISIPLLSRALVHNAIWRHTKTSLRSTMTQKRGWTMMMLVCQRPAWCADATRL